MWNSCSAAQQEDGSGVHQALPVAYYCCSLGLTGAEFCWELQLESSMSCTL